MAVEEYITKTRKAIETMMEDIRYIRRVNDYLKPRIEEYNNTNNRSPRERERKIKTPYVVLRRLRHLNE